MNKEEINERLSSFPTKQRNAIIKRCKLMKYLYEVKETKEQVSELINLFKVRHPFFRVLKKEKIIHYDHRKGDVTRVFWLNGEPSLELCIQLFQIETSSGVKKHLHETTTQAIKLKSLYDYTLQEIIAHLKERGVKGNLTYTKEETL